MIYVMSDLHGEYEKYLRMLDAIQLKEEDTLYILGDVVDRGKNPMYILKDMMKRKNIIPLLGNHDYYAYTILSSLQNGGFFKNKGLLQYLMAWRMDGGQTTYNQFNELSKEEQKEILDYFSTFSLYKEVYVNENRYILVHAGLGNFDKDKDLADYDIEELCFYRPDFNTDFFGDEHSYIVCGHTPVQFIHKEASIYHNKHNICIDCGAVFMGGKLACLCLDTMKEYYIE